MGTRHGDEQTEHTTVVDLTLPIDGRGAEAGVAAGLSSRAGEGGGLARLGFGPNAIVNCIGGTVADS